jgi:thioredoxin-like negative regulator of GroEL
MVIGQPAAVARAPGGGLRRRLSRAGRRPWPFAVLAALTLALALTAAAWVRSQPNRLYQRAQAEAHAGQYDQAAATLGRLDRIHGPTPNLRLLRAQVAGALGRTEAAVAELRAIPDEDSLAPLARLSEGQLEARRGRLQAAEAAFQATLKLTPQCAQARRELVYIYSVQRRLPELDEQLNALSEEGQLDLQHLLHWGMVRHTEWDAEQDMVGLKRYLAADPDDRYSRLALAEAQRQPGQTTAALETLAPLPDSDPDARAARTALALATGDRPAAAALLAGGPADGPALNRLRGELAMAGGDFRAAVAAFRDALAAEPTDPAVKYRLAMALTACGDRAAAEPLLAACRLHNELGKLLHRAKTEGLKDETLALRIGLACAEAGRPLEARAWLNWFIARNPLEPRAQAALRRLERAAPAGERPDPARP